MRVIPFILLSALLSGCMSMRIEEKHFVRPDKADAPKLAPLDAAALLPTASVREETVATPDGAVLRGVSVRRAGATTAVLYFGGNVFHLDQHGKEVLPQLAACGSDVLLFDYRGYGRSSGVPSVATLRDDALRLFDEANARYPGGVIVHGMSLGSFMAAYVASERPAARALVLEATATTVQDWADANKPWYTRPFMTLEVAPPLDGIDNARQVRGYRGPGLVLAGSADRITPVALGRKVFDALPGADKTWFVAPGAGHGDILGHAAVGPVYCGFVRAQVQL
jgi:pimeloyl-ACP methyl ester carboxylesterase